MKLHAGSLYRDILVLYDQMRTRAFVVQVIDQTKILEMCCHEIELFFDDGPTGTILFQGEYMMAPVWEIDIKNRITESMRIADSVIMRNAQDH